MIPADYNLDITGAELTGNDFAVSTNTISVQVLSRLSNIPLAVAIDVIVSIKETISVRVHVRGIEACGYL